MAKKAMTREEKYESYRSDLTSDKKEKNVKEKESINKPKLNPLVTDFKEKRIKKRVLYYGFVTILAIIFIVLFVYYGVMYL